MIGHRMNGGVVIMALPADDDYYVVLHVRFSNPGTEYATGLVHVSQVPNPREWWAGHYFHGGSGLRSAVEDLFNRAAVDVHDDILLLRVVDLAAATEKHLSE